MEYKKTKRLLNISWLLLACLLLAAGCSGASGDGALDDDDYGIAGPFGQDEALGKADSAGVPGPKVSTNTSQTQVWTASEKWEDTDTPKARLAGMAWAANSQLTWDQKYAAWVNSMVSEPGQNTYYDTFTLTTPWGKSLPAPKLECAELAIFLRVTFAAWYKLPFYLTASDSKGVRVYFGHFGARTKTSRYAKTPKFGAWYKDYSHLSAEALANNGWPQDEKLRGRGLYGGGDDMDWIEPGARAGAYFDEIHLNKRVGHFLRLILSYFGSVHLAGSRNTFNIEPEALSAGDVLLERWQRRGIGHTLVVKQVTDLDDGRVEAQLVSSSMPRRQPKWEDGVASKRSFTDPRTGGEGTGYDGDEYVKLGGGLKRFRVTKNLGGYWTNTWMKSDEASWISDTDYARLKIRPATFQNILGEVSPEQLRDALVAMIEDARNHLRQYPASCSARINRERHFSELYTLMQRDFNKTSVQVDADYRTLEDYVFAELEYGISKTCCWNSSTAAMHQIVMDYNQSLQANACAEPVVFKNTAGGYEVFRQYAEETGRGHLWKAWSADESCPQADVSDDTVAESTSTPFCSLPDDGGNEGPVAGNCADDGFESNDTPQSAHPLTLGNHSGLAICSTNDDYFRIELAAAGTLRIDFDHGQGDLDMQLYQGSEMIDSSESTSSSESVQTMAAGTYILRVFGYQGAAGAYSLSVSAN